MKFRIAEFDIEEFEGFDEKEQKRQNSILDEFEDEKLQERLRDIFVKSNKSYLRYAIFLNGNSVGEITFSGNDEETKFEIGIEIEEPFRNQGIAYRVLKELMARLCKFKNIEHFIYTVRYDNAASIRLAEKLGGVRAKVVKPLEQFELAIYIYHIPPIKLDHTFLTKKYIPVLKSIIESNRTFGALDDEFTEDVQTFVESNEQLGLKNYLGILESNGIQDLFGDVNIMDEQCLYAVLVYCVRSERLGFGGELKNNLENGNILRVLEKLEQLHTI